MREAAARLGAMVMLVMILFAGMIPGEPQTPDAEEATGSVVEEQEISVYIRKATAARQGAGGYLVEVEFTTHTPEKLTGMRMVMVFCGDQKSRLSLTEENQDAIHSSSFLLAEHPETVRVEVRSHQTEAGLLLISDGEGRLCGQASAPVDGDRLLYLEGGRPGASYGIYKIASLSELLSGMVALSERPTVKECQTYGVEENCVATLMVERDGTAFCNFSREGLEDGLYLVVGEGEAYYACIPQVDASGELRSSVTRLSLGETQ